MALCMLMFIFRVRVTLWTPPILNMSKNLHLEGHIVSFLFISTILLVIACLYEMLTALYLYLAIVAYLRKSKAGHKKSLLGDSDESEEKLPPKVLNLILYC